jgi:hypothetical protein
VLGFVVGRAKDSFSLSKPTVKDGCQKPRLAATPADPGRPGQDELGGRRARPVARIWLAAANGFAGGYAVSRHSLGVSVPADDLESRYGTNAPAFRVEGMTVAGA